MEESGFGPGIWLQAGALRLVAASSRSGGLRRGVWVRACVCAHVCVCVCAYVSRKDLAKVVCVICPNPAFLWEKQPRISVLPPRGVGPHCVEGALLPGREPPHVYLMPPGQVHLLSQLLARGEIALFPLTPAPPPPHCRILTGNGFLSLMNTT